MKTQNIGVSKLKTTRLAYGCMRIVGTWDPKAIGPEQRKLASRAVHAAVDAGYILFDHADIYCAGGCESVFGEILKASKGLRKNMVIATKCGIRFGGDPRADSPHRYDFSAEHILDSCDQSLKRLGIDTIDLYQLHRPDVLMNPPEIAKAFAKLKKAGKVREFGVSNFMPAKLAALRKVCPMPLIVNQVEIHLGRLACFTDGTLDQCLEQNVTPLAWSPLGGGFLGTGGKVDGKGTWQDGMRKLLALMDETAKRHGVSRTVLALAWLLKHPAKIVPIVGSANPDRINDAVKADTLELSREDWYRLYVAARMEGLP